MVSKPIIWKEIKRFGDCALVTITKSTLNADGKTYRHERLAEYETLSKGATASARREIKKLEKEEASA